MADSDPKMVLRTVYLPPDFDEKLRVRAFRTNQSKGDLVRKALAQVLDNEREEDARPSKAKSSTKHASAAAEPKMVLRTTYLPPDLDEKLRVRAFRTNQTKGELIRKALALALKETNDAVKSSVTGTAKKSRRRVKVPGADAAKGRIGSKGRLA